MRKLVRRVLLGCAAAVGLAVAAAVVWLAVPAPLLPQAAAALQSSAAVSIKQTAQWIEFLPLQAPADTALIFYPGGRVPAAAYAPAAAAIAAQNFPVFVVFMPANLAVFGKERAAAVQAAHPQVVHWVIGGHSLGGSMAAQYAAEHAGAFAGVVLWASYSPADLAKQNLQVLSIYGELDTGARTFTSAAARALLPPGARFIALPGGNHEQFGYYTGQLADPPASIARADQQAQIVAATVALMRSAAGN